MVSRFKIAFLGGGKASDVLMALAEKVGYALAELGDFFFCTGGYGGIMEAPLKGVAEYEKITSNKRRRIGYLLNVKLQANICVNEPIVCGKLDDSPEVSFGIRLGNLLASDILVFFEGGAGTRVELATALHLTKNAKVLGLKEPKHIILICKKGEENEATTGLWSILTEEERAFINRAETAEEVVALVISQEVFGLKTE